MMLGGSSPSSSTTSVVSMEACPDSQTLPAASVTGPARETTRVPAAAARASPPIDRAQPRARAKSERRNDDPILVIEFLVRVWRVGVLPTPRTVASTWSRPVDADQRTPRNYNAFLSCLELY